MATPLNPHAANPVAAPGSAHTPEEARNLDNGQRYESSYAWFLTMREDRIVAVTAFLDLAAFDAVREDR